MSNTKPIMSEKTFNKVNSIQMSVLLLLFVVSFLSKFSSATVPTASMYPTLNIDSTLIYKHVNASDLERGDIVLFFPEYDLEGSLFSNLSAVCYRYYKHKQIFIKRLIGLPGDILQTKDGILYVNGEPFDESAYLDEAVLTYGIEEPFTVPDGAFFCMGDNRENSLDSRYYGPFQQNAFFGKFVSKLPFSK